MITIFDEEEINRKLDHRIEELLAQEQIEDFPYQVRVELKDNLMKRDILRLYPLWLTVFCGDYERTLALLRKGYGWHLEEEDMLVYSNSSRYGRHEHTVTAKVFRCLMAGPLVAWYVSGAEQEVDWMESLIRELVYGITGSLRSFLSDEVRKKFVGKETAKGTTTYLPGLLRLRNRLPEVYELLFDGQNGEREWVELLDLRNIREDARIWELFGIWLEKNHLSERCLTGMLERLVAKWPVEAMAVEGILGDTALMEAPDKNRKRTELLKVYQEMFHKLSKLITNSELDPTVLSRFLENLEMVMKTCEEVLETNEIPYIRDWVQCWKAEFEAEKERLVKLS